MNKKVIMLEIKTNYLIVALVSCFFSLTVYGQTVQITDSIKWRSPKEIQVSKYDKVSMIYFEDAQFGGDFNGLPYFSGYLPLKNRTEVRSLQLGRAIFAPFKSEETAIIQSNTYNSNQPIIEYETVYDQGKPVLAYRIYPYRKIGNSIERLTQFSLEATLIESASNSRPKSSTTNSVLSSGDWIRVGVTNSGVYKISKSQLSQLGFNVSVNPRSIRLYGNGGAQLPERNNIYYPDDLAENAIYVEGEGDGSFDDSDFILFYAQGPVSWSYDKVKGIFKHSKNIYADTTWYFLTTSAGQGKRISSQSSSTLSPTNNVTEYDDYSFVENDEENVLLSGRRWFGNKMESGVNSHAFNVAFSGATNGPHKLVSNLIARGLSATPFSINVNGQTYTQQVNALSSLGYLDTYAKENESVFTLSGNLSNLSGSVVKNNSSTTGWIDYLIFNVRRNLNFSGSQTAFRSINEVLPGNVCEYVLQDANSSTRVWEVTNLYDIKVQEGNLNGSTFRFVAASDTLRQWLALNYNASFPAPIFGGTVQNQNLHGTSQVDMVIVSHPQFIASANALADHHRSFNAMSVAVVTPQQIYNEFSSGNQDISGIRNFLRMFYERSQAGGNTLKYLLLVGDGSYDPKYRIANNQNWIPTYESVESLSPIGSFCSDDFYGFLDPTEGTSIQSVGAGMLDIGIGRLVVNSVEEANAVVNKIIHYSTAQECMDDWRNVVTFVADDEDNNDHFDQSQLVSEIINTNFPVYNIYKIYLDAYQQENGSGGQRYPQVNTDIANRIERGSLIMNYAGHGGEQSLALERVITIPDINSWESLDDLTLFMTATCEFSRFDNPAFTSAGEYVLLNPIGGGVALFTTVRLTFSSSNEALNRNVMNVLFVEENSENLRLGEIIRRGKNATGSSFNNRSFALLGDPAMTLAYPKYDVFTTTINGNAIGAAPDTISALDLVTVEGIVTGPTGAILEDFNGIVTPTVYDKAAIYYTLGNDPGSLVRPFQLQKNVIFRGPATVTNGRFTFSFVVPEDIQFNFGNGKISYYAEKSGTLIDAHGYTTSDLVVGGYSENPISDDIGPEIRLFMNNEQFADGGITDENPVFLAYVQDDIGINTVGTGIGHDITAILDEDSQNPIVLNDFYEAVLDDFRKGIIRYPLRNLAEGPHVITLKVWDVANNSATASLRFVVVKSEEPQIQQLLNYPNPFTTSTQFFFEFNQPGIPVDVDVQIFTVSGKTVTTLRSSQVMTGYRSEPIHWDGLDDYGDRIGRGVYMYRVRVKTPDGKSVEKFEKLVIL